MDYRILGRTGLSVSALGLGSGGHSRLGLRQDQGEENAIEILKYVLEADVNFVDTAETYGFCRDEPGIHMVLSGTGNRNHLASNLHSIAGLPLPDEMRFALQQLFIHVDNVTGN